MELPRRTLGKTGITVTSLGLGGEGILRTYGYEQEAERLINRALDLGINYCESARAYAASELYYGHALKERRKDVFLTSKSHDRTKRGARGHLVETLRNMNTDRLDLWQVHDIRTVEDMEEIFARGGAMEAFREAKEEGHVRFVGITGHQDPDIIVRCMELYDFDTVLMPVNPLEPSYQSFIEKVLPVALAKEMGIIAMKVYVRGIVTQAPGFTSLEPYLRFALSHPVSTAVVGCDTIEQLEENHRFACAFQPMNDDEMAELITGCAPFARRLMYYKP